MRVPTGVKAALVVPIAAASLMVTDDASGQTSTTTDQTVGSGSTEVSVFIPQVVTIRREESGEYKVMTNAKTGAELVVVEGAVTGALKY